MKWSWDEYEATPVAVIARLIEKVKEEEDQRAADEQLRELRNRVGGRRL